MEKTTQLYCNVNAEGEIQQSIVGENIIPSDPFAFFFMIDEQTAENIFDYKVEVVGMEPRLVKKV